MEIYDRRNMHLLWAFLLALIFVGASALLVGTCFLGKKSLKVEEQLDLLERKIQGIAATAAVDAAVTGVSSQPYQIVLTGFKSVSSTLSEDSIERDLKVKVNGKPMSVKLKRPSQELAVFGELRTEDISPKTRIEVRMPGVVSPITLAVPAEKLTNGASAINISDSEYRVAKN